MNNKVYLVGAGPGDPGLITVKGRDCIATADVIIYDYLAAPALLSHARKDAQRIYVGKKGGDHTLPQDQINQLIVEKARQGLTVCRLKGGDPFIFGRGGEEIEELIAAGIDFEVVPGVTSAIAAPAYAGIPLTHRRLASSVTFITGHEDPAKETSSIHWEALANIGGTLVFFMGVKNLPHITGQLLSFGMKAETPVALVRWGTTPSQQTVTGTLETILSVAESAAIRPPSLIVVGDVVSLRDSMKWFENRPLFGKTIVVTRARTQASDMVARLTQLGANCIECPVIKVVPADDDQNLDAAISKIKEYDWLIFTSVNGVDYFFSRLYENEKDFRCLGHLQTAVIGPATAERLKNYGINTDILPESFRAESIIDAFKNETVSGKKILLPRAKQSRPILPDELTKMGATVHEVTAYQTILDADQGQMLIDQLEAGKIDMITFTSSSTVTNFKSLIPADRFDALIKNVTIAAIGPITAETAQKNGFIVHLSADEYTIPGLCEAILRYYKKF
jgi:uroporphyrinogen III methyltransferase / synthase